MNPSILLHPRLYIALSLVLFTGCGSGLYPVNGKVVWKDGSPATELSGSNIVFEGEKTSSLGSIQPDGSFQLTTNDLNDGAPPGKYTVLIAEVGRKPQPGGDGTTLAPGVIDSRYADSKTSGLAAEVTAGENKITLAVERNPEG